MAALARDALQKSLFMHTPQGNGVGTGMTPIIASYRHPRVPQARHPAPTGRSVSANSPLRAGG
jgi:hypothetical protein